MGTTTALKRRTMSVVESAGAQTSGRKMGYETRMTEKRSIGSQAQDGILIPTHIESNISLEPTLSSKTYDHVKVDMNSKNRFIKGEKTGKTLNIHEANKDLQSMVAFN